MTAIAVAMPLALLGMIFLLLRLSGVPTTTATVFGAVAAGLLAIYVGIHLLTITSGWFPSSGRTWLLAAVWGALIGTGAAALVTVFTGGFGGAAVAVGAVGGLVSVPLARRSATKSVTSDSPLPSQVRTMDIAEAEAALRAAEARLASAGRDRAKRASAEIQRADALRALAAHAGTPDRLHEIAESLRPLVDDDALPIGLRYAAACGLVELRSLQAEITRDETGWDEALELLSAIATPAVDPGARGRYLHDLGDRETYRAAVAMEMGADALGPSRAALAAFREALRELGDESGFGPLLRSKIAQQAFTVALADRDGPRIGSARHTIGELRETLALYRGRRRDGRELVELAIAWMQCVDADEEERLTVAVTEAESIGTRLARQRRRPELAGPAHELLAEVTRLQLELTPELSTDRRASLRMRRIAHLEAAFRARRALSIATAAETGRLWAEAVAAERDDTATADAYAELVRQVPVEALRRLRHHDRATFVATQQGIATEAGRWLATAGRLAEAVDAIEDARAILLGQRAARVPDDLAAALSAHPDVYADYVAAAQELEAQERSLHVHTDTATAHRARGRFDLARLAVVDLLGAGTERPGRLAAHAVAPTVYLGATDRGGYAIVVGPNGVPAWTPLPEAGSAVLDRQLAVWRRFLADRMWRQSAAGEAGLVAVLEWAWDAIMCPLVPQVSADAVLTLVPLGGLGLLPLHAAGRDGRVVDDLVTVAYAPSARMAAQARRDAMLAVRRPPMLLGVGVPDVPGVKRLPLAAAEIEEVCALVPSIRPCPATRAATLSALSEATIWHFACHGEADPVDPLASRLLVADGELTLADVLARPSAAYRLAVLSACETAVPDRARLDEMIGFPGALMQAGVAGVVASGWPVRDDAAFAFAVRLHELLTTGVAPAAAARHTRTWLRTVTRGELHDRFGKRFAPDLIPAHRRDRWRAQRPYRSPREWAAFGFTGT